MGSQHVQHVGYFRGDVDFLRVPSVALFCSSFLIPPFAALQHEILKVSLSKRLINQEGFWSFGAVPNLSTIGGELSASRPTCFTPEEGIFLGIQIYFAVEVIK
jgi:hypothetical protein